MRGSFCASLTLALSLKGEGVLVRDVSDRSFVDESLVMSLRNRIRHDQRGFALVGLLCMMLLLAVTAMAVNRQAGLQARRTANQTRVAQSYLGGVAAVEHAVWNLMQDPTWRTAAGGEDYTFEGVTYNRKVLDTGTIACSRVITVTITPPGGLESTEALFLWHPETLTIADTDNHRVRVVDPATGVISTVAGTGSGGYTGDGALATTKKLNKPYGVWRDASCNLFIADKDNARIRKVDQATGLIETVAGTGTDGYSGDLGLATSANINKPCGVSVASSGEIYIADTDNHRIRIVKAVMGWRIYTFAGTGSSGYSGDGGLATIAKINKPEDVFFDASGSLYMADTGNHCIRKVWWSGLSWIIGTAAGTGSSGYSGDGGSATSAKLNNPRGVYVDASGNIYIADTDNNVIRRVDAGTGNIATVAGTGSSGYSGDGGPATSAMLNKPEDVYLDVSGDLYIADTQNNVIRRVDAGTGIITTVAGTGSSGDSGDGGPATSAKLDKPSSICINLPGSLTTPLERLN